MGKVDQDNMLNTMFISFAINERLKYADYLFFTRKPTALHKLVSKYLRELGYTPKRTKSNTGYHYIFNSEADKYCLNHLRFHFENNRCRVYSVYDLSFNVEFEAPTLEHFIWKLYRYKFLNKRYHDALYRTIAQRGKVPPKAHKMERNIRKQDRQPIEISLDIKKEVTKIKKPR